MPYSLSDRVLIGLLAVEDRELRVVVRHCADRIRPRRVLPRGAAYDRRGRLVYAASIDRYWLYYWISRSGRIHFVEMVGDS